MNALTLRLARRLRRLALLLLPLQILVALAPLLVLELALRLGLIAPLLGELLRPLTPPLRLAVGRELALQLRYVELDVFYLLRGELTSIAMVRSKARAFLMPAVSTTRLACARIASRA